MESRGVSVLALLTAFAGAALMTGDAVAAQCGKAAWYDLGGQTASGEPSDGSALAAAHRSLPFGTRVRVENLSNGRNVIVRINDRGPFVGGRVIDVTRAAAEELGMIQSGIAKVRVSVVDGKAKLDASCEDPSPRMLTAEAVANEAKAKSRSDPEPAATQTAAVAEPDQPAADPVSPAEEPGTVAATPSPNESKSGNNGSRKVLVATVQYDEGSGNSAAAPSSVPDVARRRCSVHGRAPGRRPRRRKGRGLTGRHPPAPTPAAHIWRHPADLQPHAGAPFPGRLRARATGNGADGSAWLRADPAARRDHHRIA